MSLYEYKNSVSKRKKLKKNCAIYSQYNKNSHETYPTTSKQKIAIFVYYFYGNMTIKEVQSKVDKWIKDYGVRYFNELTNMALLTEEVGEVARIIARKYGEQTPKSTETEVELADELADVIFVVVCLANQTGIDLEKAIEKNILKKTERDKTRHKLVKS
jgi:NTP pyrophosphatase (non-canonical NTP hydrolase)